MTTGSSRNSGEGWLSGIRSTRVSSLAAATALLGAVAAAIADPRAASGALSTDWPPFVLVSGLLVIGFVANADGLFALAGSRLARMPGGYTALFCAGVVLVAVVSATLNLDTAVAFVTPTLAYAARSRSRPAGPVVYASLLTANGASLLLPGSNLTNLIVLGNLHLPGGSFALRMLPATVLAVCVSGAVVALAHRSELAASGEWRAARQDQMDSGAGALPGGTRPAGPSCAGASTGAGAGAGTGTATGALGAAAVVAAAAALLAAPAPALPVAAIALAAYAGHRIRPGRRRPQRSFAAASGSSHPEPRMPGGPPVSERPRSTGMALGEILEPRVLIGLLATAIGLGTLGRAWSAPAQLLGHLDAYATAALGAISSVALNNLPAASILGARSVPHPYALLLGLNVGPDLLVTGSLSWVIWLKAARLAGERPSIRHAALLGTVAVPVTIAAGVWSLALSTPHP